MKNLLALLVLAACVLFVTSSNAAENKYVGVKMCGPCHKPAKIGDQFDVWKKSKHADAYKTLTTDTANAIAKKMGLKKAAAESPECLECHAITADPKLTEKTFDVKDGVQCESCHGPGSAYKSMSVMKDQAKAVAAGLSLYKDDAAIQAKCETCHNKKSPTFKEFKFKEMWGKIKHSVPKSKS
jgi:hypothetical protein